MDYKKQYVNFLKRFIKLDRPLRVVFDCSNGTTGIILREILNNESGIKNKGIKTIIHNSKFIILNSKPDGNFPAHGPNPMIPGAMDELIARVKKENADLGVAFDGDGDRVFFIDNIGRLVNAHEAGYILAQIFKPPFVVSEIASWRLKKRDPSTSSGRRVKSEKRKAVFVSPVGHYFFKNLMRKKKASLGLEHSGHFYFRDFFYCDSGILAAIHVMNFISGLNSGLAEWLNELPKYYRSGEINFRLSDTKLQMTSESAKDKILKKIENKYKKKGVKIRKIDGLTVEFRPSSLRDKFFSKRKASQSSNGEGARPELAEGWFNARPSNTENLLRLNVEATSDFFMKKVLKEVSALISGR